MFAYLFFGSLSVAISDWKLDYDRFDIGFFSLFFHTQARLDVDFQANSVDINCDPVSTSIMSVMQINLS